MNLRSPVVLVGLVVAVLAGLWAFGWFGKGTLTLEQAHSMAGVHGRVPRFGEYETHDLLAEAERKLDRDRFQRERTYPRDYGEFHRRHERVVMF